MSTVKKTATSQIALLWGPEMLPLIKLARGEDEAQRLANKRGRALARALLDAGFTPAMCKKSPAKVTLANEETSKRAALKLIALASMKADIGGKEVRLTDENLVKAMSREVANTVLLQGLPKGTLKIGGKTITTWLGNLSSRMDKLFKLMTEEVEREAAEAAAEASGEGKPEGKGAKKRNIANDRDFFTKQIQTGLNRIERGVDKLDSSFSEEEVKKIAAYVRGLSQFGIKLQKPKA